LIIFLPGCTSKDIDKRAFVTAIGIDKSENTGKKFKIITKISLSKGDPKSVGADFTLLTFEADSISEALRRMKSLTDKELVYGSTKAILIGEKVAKMDIRPLLDFFMRREDIQKTSYLSVAKPSAYEVLQYKPKVEKVAGSYLFSAFDYTGSESPYVSSLFLFDGYRRETEAGIDMAIPVIELYKGKLKIDKITLFNKKNIQMELNPEESQIYRLLTNGIQNGQINIKTNAGTYAVKIEKGKTKIKLNESKTTALVQIRLNGSVEENLESSGDLNATVIKDLEKQTEKKIQEYVQHLLVSIQKKKLDPIGFGLRFRSRHLNHERIDQQWNQLYSLVQFQVVPECNIKGTGLIR
jgi:Ger(x)C family germination protein